ncbi:tetratricopeptide repeat protein [Campylobacter lanienae]|uniref:tetratricopeptide repeat protein n=1 Tax=Campylobacter lanienae TaxID=75658 RepID=UPI001F250261|nr:tetratricopeptide repeat protein [Campylobacter lanienae]
MTKIIWIVALLFSVVVAKDMEPKKLESSCDNGDMDACFSLGKLYYTGEGVKQNYQKAAELSKKACDGRNPYGCGILGALYAEGKGVKQNYQKAF